MKHFTLGNTGLVVSAYSLGCLNFGSRTDKKTSFQLLDHFFEAGETFWIQPIIMRSGTKAVLAEKASLCLANG